MNAKPIEKQFWHYVLPSMLTMLLGGFYAIVDGFFVGRAVGDVGLAAINIAWPVQSLMTSAGTGIGVGGAVVMSLRAGTGDHTRARMAKGNTILLLGIFSLLFMAVFLPNLAPILRFLGAEDETHAAAMDYARVITLGAGLQIMATGLTPLLRNSGRAIQATVAMMSGLFTNIVLDAVLIFIFDMGMAGAALATIIAQGLVALICVILVIRNREKRPRRVDFKPDGQTMRETVRIGVSPFGLTLAPSVIIVFANWQCLRYGGALAVAAFSVVSYVLASAQALMQGVGDGIQPIVSFCRGAGRWDSVRAVRRKAFVVMLVLSAVLLGLVVLARAGLPAVFGVSPAAAAVTGRALVISAFAYPALGTARLSSAYFYAVGQARCSALLAYLDPLFVTPALMLVLPLLSGLDGVWLSLALAQLVMAVVALLLLRRERREEG